MDDELWIKPLYLNNIYTKRIVKMKRVFIRFLIKLKKSKFKYIIADGKL